MHTPTKTILKLFSTTALIRANGILKNSKNVNGLVDTASKKIHSGKNKILSIQSDLTVLLAMLKAWAKGDYNEVPWMTLLLSTGALIYFVNPFDAIPDIVPVVGLLDDATVIGFVVASIKQDIQNFSERKYNYPVGQNQLPA
ncbi:MAG: YkvA family protein [Candidatus Dadabacteria bacterium]|nr:YkvA family protein [Candidatus Dadabacteria bacterium]